MDIRRWLENTADKEPPDRSDDIDIPETFRDDRPMGDRVGRSYRYKRKRASTDSSIIAPNKDSHRNARAPSRSSSSGRGRPAEGAARGYHGDDSSQRSQSAIAVAPEKTYERRARHKTRADRYEPKVKKQKKQRKEQKGNGKRRKSHRNDDGGRTKGLVQGFQLKHWPRNNRLTLKPDTSAGLFKHGRASVQIAGRGAGLPDLVFNEMRFLQKPTDRQDEVGGDNMLRTKDHKPDQAEEMSAYFKAKTTINNEHHEKRNEPEDRTNVGNAPAKTKLSKEADHSKSLIGLPDKPFLGFGSRGIQPVSNPCRDDDTSYYTWCDSVQRNSSPPLKDLNQAHNINLYRNQTKRPRNGAHRLVRPVQEKAMDAEAVSWGRTGRGGSHPLVEVFKPLRSPQRKPRDDTPVLKTTSQSLPRHPSSPPHGRNNETRQTVYRGRDDCSYHTSDILRIHGAPTTIADIYPQSQLYTPHENYDKENRDPESSLSIDKAIRQARMAAETSQFITQPPFRARDTGVAILPNMRRTPSISNLPRIHQLHRPSSMQANAAEPGWQKPNPPVYAQWHSPVIHRPLSKAEQLHWERAAFETLRSRAPRTNYMQHPSYVDEDEEMLDNIGDMEADSIRNDAVSMEMLQVNDERYDERFTPHSIYEAQLNAVVPAPTMSAVSGFEINRSGPVRGLSIEKELYSGNSVDQQSALVDSALAGFWKPNILY